MSNFLWLEKRIENWIRFGHAAEEQILDKRRRILSFAPGKVFSRSCAGPRTTSAPIISRIDILRAVAPGQRCATVPYVRPGGDILLRLSGWPKVERVLQIDRRRRGARHRPGRRRARLLAPRPQPHVCQRSAAAIHALAPSGLASSAKDRAMNSRAATLLTTLGAAVALLSTVGAKSAHYIWNVFRERSHRSLSAATDRQPFRHRTGRVQPA